MLATIRTGTGRRQVNLSTQQILTSIFLINTATTSKRLMLLLALAKSQAYRLGKWFLYTSHRETEVCSFSTDILLQALLFVLAITSRLVIQCVLDVLRFLAVVSSGSTTDAIKLKIEVILRCLENSAPVGFDDQSHYLA